MTKLHVISLGMVNVYLLEGRQNVLVDTGTKKDGSKILDAVKALGLDPSNIDLIILTHNHPDHIGSVKRLIEKTNAKVLMDEMDYKTLIGEIPDEVKPLNRIAQLVLFVATKLSKNGPQIPDFKPDILVKDIFDLGDFGIDGKVIHSPGHTKGSLCVLLEDGSVILGDHLMAMISKKKLSKPMLAYDMNLVKKSIKTLIDLGATRFYLSHGRDYDKEVVLRTLDKI